MLRISKKAEYGLLSLQYIAMNRGKVATAKEIAEYCDISFDLVAKVLRQLGKAELLISFQGIQGGYQLAKSPRSISMSEILEALEGKLNIVECTASQPHECRCTIEGSCTLKSPMEIIQERLVAVFSSMTLEEMTHNVVHFTQPTIVAL